LLALLEARHIFYVSLISVKETSATADLIQYCNYAEQKYSIVPVIGATAQGVLITAICRYEEYKALRKKVVTNT
jgi:hypothetical protein